MSVYSPDVGEHPYNHYFEHFFPQVDCLFLFYLVLFLMCLVTSFITYSFVSICFLFLCAFLFTRFSSFHFLALDTWLYIGDGLQGPAHLPSGQHSQMLQVCPLCGFHAPFCYDRANCCRQVRRLCWILV